jgi:hypothetical protein
VTVPRPSRPGDLAARLLLATRWIDRAQLFFDRVRSELVTGLASDTVLDRFNDLVYSDAGGYDPDDPAFRSYLFPWEDEAIERFFPPPPAKILIGGGGSGRETFALLDLGYDVVTFDPSEGLIDLTAKRITSDMSLRVFQAGYEELPRLRSPVSGEPHDLRDLGPFDASVLGWGSYSHLRADEHRVQTLRRFAEVTDGPIVVSFLHLGERHRGQLRRFGRIRERLRSRHGRTEGDAFSIYIGFYHVFDDPEIRDLARRAGLAVRHLSEARESWPYAVLQRV